MSTVPAGNVQTKATRKTIRLSSIVPDKKLWPRQGVDPDRVKEFKTLYKEEPEALPPVIVAEHPKKPGKYLLVDGWHRIAALQQLYRDAELPADVLPKDTDVYAEATRLSSISSKPLTILEKRAAVRRLLDEHPKWSDSQIARTAGVSHPFVGSQRKLLTRMAGEAKDAVQKALTTAPGATTATTATREEPGINQLLFNVIQDSRADQITLDIWRSAAERWPQYKQAMRHIGTVLYQASQDTAPASATGNVTPRSGGSAAITATAEGDRG